MLTEAEHRPRKVDEYYGVNCIQCQKKINQFEFTWHTEGMKEFCSKECYQTYETKLEELRKQWKGKSAEEFLRAVYPNKKARKDVKLVDLTDFYLTGVLDVSDFGEWYRTQIVINGNPNLGEIIDRKEEKTRIIVTIAQEYLNYWYPINGTCLMKGTNFGKRREEMEELFISNQNLTGPLNLVGFENLTELHCGAN